MCLVTAVRVINTRHGTRKQITAFIFGRRICLFLDVRMSRTRASSSSVTSFSSVSECQISVYDASLERRVPRSFYIPIHGIIKYQYSATYGTDNFKRRVDQCIRQTDVRGERYVFRSVLQLYASRRCCAVHETSLFLRL